MPNTITDESAVVTAGEHLTTELDGELVILDGDSGTYYGLNEVGRRIWDLLEEPHSIGDLQKAIVAEYDVERERCERDVHTLVEDLASKGLVDVRPDETE